MLKLSLPSTINSYSLLGVKPTKSPILTLLSLLSPYDGEPLQQVSPVECFVKFIQGTLLSTLSSLTSVLLLSVFFITAIKGDFDRPKKTIDNQKTINLIKEGVSWLSNQILLRRLAIYTGIANFFGSMQFPIMILFGQEILGLDSVQFAFLNLEICLVNHKRVKSQLCHFY